MSRPNRYWYSTASFVLLIALSIASIPSCRKKVTGGDDTDTTQNPGSWRLVTYTDGILRAGMFDTINVRLYNGFGTLQNQQIVNSISLQDPETVVATVVTSDDTLRHPWGTSLINPLRYWGVGGADGTETVFSWVVRNGDTIATATTTFKVNP